MGRMEEMEVIDLTEDEPVETQASRICSICETGGDLLECQGICARRYHLECLNVSKTWILSRLQFQCGDCITNEHQCFKCKEYAKDKDLVQCTFSGCGRFYHRKCVRSPEHLSKVSFVCPSHHCRKCHRRCLPNESVHCCRCPIAYCIQCSPSTHLWITDEIMICLKHILARETNPPQRSLTRVHDRLENGRQKTPTIQEADGNSTSTSTLFLSTSSDDSESEQEECREASTQRISEPEVAVKVEQQHPNDVDVAMDSINRIEDEKVATNVEPTAVIQEPNSVAVPDPNVEEKDISEEHVPEANSQMTAEELPPPTEPSEIQPEDGVASVSIDEMSQECLTKKNEESEKVEMSTSIAHALPRPNAIDVAASFPRNTVPDEEKDTTQSIVAQRPVYTKEAEWRVSVGARRRRRIRGPVKKKTWSLIENSGQDMKYTAQQPELHHDPAIPTSIQTILIAKQKRDEKVGSKNGAYDLSIQEERGPCGAIPASIQSVLKQQRENAARLKSNVNTEPCQVPRKEESRKTQQDASAVVPGRLKCNRDSKKLHVNSNCNESTHGNSGRHKREISLTKSPQTPLKSTKRAFSQPHVESNLQRASKRMKEEKDDGFKRRLVQKLDMKIDGKTSSTSLSPLQTPTSVPKQEGVSMKSSESVSKGTKNGQIVSPESPNAKKTELPASNSTQWSSRTITQVNIQRSTLASRLAEREEVPIHPSLKANPSLSIEMEQESARRFRRLCELFGQ